MGGEACRLGKGMRGRGKAVEADRNTVLRGKKRLPKDKVNGWGVNGKPG